MKKPHISITVLLTGRFESPQVWYLEIPPMPALQAADLVFALSNAPEHALDAAGLEMLKNFPRTGLRSVSVGDVLIIENVDSESRSVLTCESNGFKSH